MAKGRSKEVKVLRAMLQNTVVGERLKLSDAARLVGMHAQTLRRAIHAGELACEKEAKLYFVMRADVLTWAGVDVTAKDPNEETAARLLSVLANALK